MDWPKGLLEGAKPGLCGMEPARRRERSDALLACSALKPVILVGVVPLGLKGLVDGVGLEVFETNTDCGLSAPSPAAGEKREGSVPARVLPLAPGWGVVSGGDW